MSGNPLFGKFGPIILLGVLQLVLIIAVPSTAPTAANSALGNGAGRRRDPPTAGPAAPAGRSTAAVGPCPAAPSTAPAGRVNGGDVAGGSATGGNVAGGGSGGPATAASGAGLQKLSGDRSHCVNGRQFDANLDYYAPTCVPGKPGDAYPNNGGATWRGVTNNTIELVNYVADYGAEVDQILKAQGTYYNADTAKQWNEPFANFINTHYTLWGRKIHIDTVAGTCTTVPPDYACLQSEMDSIVAKYHPFGVFWETTAVLGVLRRALPSARRQLRRRRLLRRVPPRQRAVLLPRRRERDAGANAVRQVVLRADGQQAGDLRGHQEPRAELPQHQAASSASSAPTTRTTRRRCSRCSTRRWPSAASRSTDTSTSMRRTSTPRLSSRRRRRRR